MEESGPHCRVRSIATRRRRRMHTGRIKKIIRDRGFGFISDTDGREVFFHQSSIVGMDFASLREDQPVEFEVEKSAKGPRAINVRITKE
jgi:CspA family cold shock protein